MPPRPILHWKSFWLGSLVFMALAFLWAVSMDSLRGVAIKSASGWAFAGQFEGEIGFARHADIRPWGTGAVAGERFALIDDYGTGGSPEYGVWWKETMRPGWVLRYGQLALLFLVSWVTWLGWRWRGVKRLQTRLEGNS